jgi:hypothetical protein
MQAISLWQRENLVADLNKDKLVKKHSPVFVIPANAGIQGSRLTVLDSCSPIRSRTRFAGVTALETFYETINVDEWHRYTSLMKR